MRAEAKRKLRPSVDDSDADGYISDELRVDTHTHASEDVGQLASVEELVPITALFALPIEGNKRTSGVYPFMSAEDIALATIHFETAIRITKELQRVSLAMHGSDKTLAQSLIHKPYASLTQNATDAVLSVMLHRVGPPRGQWEFNLVNQDVAKLAPIRRVYKTAAADEEGKEASHIRLRRGTEALVNTALLIEAGCLPQRAPAWNGKQEEGEENGADYVTAQEEADKFLQSFIQKRNETPIGNAELSRCISCASALLGTTLLCTRERRPLQEGYTYFAQERIQRLLSWLEASGNTFNTAIGSWVFVHANGAIHVITVYYIANVRHRRSRGPRRSSTSSGEHAHGNTSDDDDDDSDDGGSDSDGSGEGPPNVLGGSDDGKDEDDDADSDDDDDDDRHMHRRNMVSVEAQSTDGGDGSGAGEEESSSDESSVEVEHGSEDEQHNAAPSQFSFQMAFISSASTVSRSSGFSREAVAGAFNSIANHDGQTPIVTTLVSGEAFAWTKIAAGEAPVDYTMTPVVTKQALDAEDTGEFKREELVMRTPQNKRPAAIDSSVEKGTLRRPRLDKDKRGGLEVWTSSEDNTFGISAVLMRWNMILDVANGLLDWIKCEDVNIHTKTKALFTVTSARNTATDPHTQRVERVDGTALRNKAVATLRAVQSASMIVKLHGGNASRLVFDARRRKYIRFGASNKWVDTAHRSIRLCVQRMRKRASIVSPDEESENLQTFRLWAEWWTARMLCNASADTVDIHTFPYRYMATALATFMATEVNSVKHLDDMEGSLVIIIATVMARAVDAAKRSLHNVSWNGIVDVALRSFGLVCMQCSCRSIDDIRSLMMSAVCCRMENEAWSNTQTKTIQFLCITPESAVLVRIHVRSNADDSQHEESVESGSEGDGVGQMTFVQHQFAGIEYPDAAPHKPVPVSLGSAPAGGHDDAESDTNTRQKENTFQVEVTDFVTGLTFDGFGNKDETDNVWDAVCAASFRVAILLQTKNVPVTVVFQPWEIATSRDKNDSFTAQVIQLSNAQPKDLLIKRCKAFHAKVQDFTIDQNRNADPPPPTNTRVSVDTWRYQPAVWRMQDMFLGSEGHVWPLYGPKTEHMPWELDFAQPWLVNDASMEPLHERPQSRLFVFLETLATPVLAFVGTHTPDTRPFSHTGRQQKPFLDGKLVVSAVRNARFTCRLNDRSVSRAHNILPPSMLCARLWLARWIERPTPNPPADHTNNIDYGRKYDNDDDVEDDIYRRLITAEKGSQTVWMPIQFPHQNIDSKHTDRTTSGVDRLRPFESTMPNSRHLAASEMQSDTHRGEAEGQGVGGHTASGANSPIRPEVDATGNIMTVVMPLLVQNSCHVQGFIMANTASGTPLEGQPHDSIVELLQNSAPSLILAASIASKVSNIEREPVRAPEGQAKIGVRNAYYYFQHAVAAFLEPLHTLGLDFGLLVGHRPTRTVFMGFTPGTKRFAGPSARTMLTVTKTATGVRIEMHQNPGYAVIAGSVLRTRFSWTNLIGNQTAPFIGVLETSNPAVVAEESWRTACSLKAALLRISKARVGMRSKHPERNTVGHPDCDLTRAAWFLMHPKATGPIAALATAIASPYVKDASVVDGGLLVNNFGVWPAIPRVLKNMKLFLIPITGRAGRKLVRMMTRPGTNPGMARVVQRCWATIFRCAVPFIPEVLRTSPLAPPIGSELTGSMCESFAIDIINGNTGTDTQVLVTVPPDARLLEELLAVVDEVCQFQVRTSRPFPALEELLHAQEPIIQLAGSIQTQLDISIRRAKRQSLVAATEANADLWNVFIQIATQSTTRPFPRFNLKTEVREILNAATYELMAMAGSAKRNAHSPAMPKTPSPNGRRSLVSTPGGGP